MKRTVIVAAAVAVFLLAAFVFAFSAADAGTSAYTSTGRISVKPVIIIDAGHGGIDGGAVGVSGTVEKNVNLQIAIKLRNKLTVLGFKVVMTRETDISIHDPDAATVRQKKASDLKNRLKLTELYPNSILISIHQNTINVPSVRGAEVFYSPNNESSRVLASYIQDALNAQMRAGKPRTITEAGSNLYLFYNATNTAVLVECGFLSNSDEEALLCSDEYQDMLALTISTALLTYLKDV